MAVIDRALTASRRAGARAIRLIGEPGIGKTFLLNEVAVRADESGNVVARGAASELQLDVPFSPFVEALNDLVSDGADELVSGMSADARNELASIFPVFGTNDTSPSDIRQHERFRTLFAMRELLGALAQRRPLVLLLDDTHWADAGSVELLGTLLHRPPDGPVLLISAARPYAMSERLRAAAAHAVRSHTLIELPLAPFSIDEARDFLGGSVPDGELARLYEQSGGNAFYLEELARGRRSGLAGAGALSSVDGAVPASVMSAVVSELATLGAAARKLIDGAAIAGDPFDVELAGAAAGLDETESLVAVDELLAVDLIRPTDVARRFRLRHPLVRRAVYDAIPAGSRIAGHRRCADALARLSVPPAGRAHHVEIAAARGDFASFAVLREAAQATAPRAPAIAARWLAAALRILRDTGDDEQRIELLVELADAHTAVGRLELARTALIEALALVATEDMSTRVALIADCSALEQRLGLHAEAEGRLLGALKQLEGVDSLHRVAVLLNLASNTYYRQRIDESRRWAEEAHEAALSIGDLASTAHGAAACAMACASAGATVEAERWRLEAVGLLNDLPDSALVDHLDAFACLAAMEVYSDLLDECVAHGARGLAIGRTAKRGPLFPLLTQSVAVGYLTLGKLAESAEVLDAAIEAARLSEDKQFLAWSLLNRSYLASHQGWTDVARTMADEAVELTSVPERSALSMFAKVSQGIALMGSGRYARAAQLLTDATGGESMPLMGAAVRAKYLDRVARCHILAGQLDEARRTIGHMHDLNKKTGSSSGEAWTQRSEATLAVATGDFELAAQLSGQSASYFERAGTVIEEAQARLILGQAMVAMGDVDQGIEELEAVLAVAAERGALGLRRSAERELRLSGAAADHGQLTSGLASLTTRERELAELVAERKTNAQIAAELFLSTKTVETHLRNIFRKLDVDSRIGVAEAIQRAAPKDIQTRADRARS